MGPAIKEATMKDVLNGRLSGMAEILQDPVQDSEGNNIVLPTGDVQGSPAFTKTTDDGEKSLDYLGTFQAMESGEEYTSYQNTKVLLDTATKEGTQTPPTEEGGN